MTKKRVCDRRVEAYQIKIWGSATGQLPTTRWKDTSDFVKNIWRDAYRHHLMLKSKET